MGKLRDLTIVAASALLACAASGAKDGTVTIQVAGLAEALPITRVTVEVQPPGAMFDLVKEGTGVWTGTLVVPEGTRTLVVRAYVDAALVGEGSATVDVVAGQTASAVVTVLDVTGPPPALDHGPIIRSLVASKRTLAPGEHATLTVDALDPDGDPLSYQWSETCPSGAFGSPNAAKTEWWSDAEAGCTLSVQVTSGAFTASESILLLVQGPAPAGQVAVSTEFVPQPYVDSVYVSGYKAPDPYWEYYVSKTLTSMCTYCFVTSNATLPMKIRQLQRQPLYTNHRNVPNASPDLQVWMDDDCGGTVEWDGTLYNSGQAFYSWIAPPTNGLCMITAHVSYRGLSDTLTLAALVDGCPEDTFEPNDTAESAADLGWLAPPSPASPPGTTGGFERAGLRGNEPDWFEFKVNVDRAATITAASSSPVPLELWADDGIAPTLVASGVDTLSFAAGSALTYRLLVDLAAPPDACGPAYDLRIEPGAPVP